MCSCCERCAALEAHLALSAAELMRRAAVCLARQRPVVVLEDSSGFALAQASDGACLAGGRPSALRAELTEVAALLGLWA